MRSRIEPMKKIAHSLRQHRELILNYFRAKTDFQRGRGGLEQQGESQPEKILRLSHLPGTRTGPLLPAWQAA